MKASRLLSACAATCAAAAAFPVAASAASVRYSADSGPDPGYFVVYKASKGEKNRLTVSGTETRIVFSDPGAKRITKTKGSFRGCSFKMRKRVVCKVENDIAFTIELGDRDDRLSFKGFNRSSYGRTLTTKVGSARALMEESYNPMGANTEHLSVSGGKGNDNLRGTRFHDVFYPGAGRDKVDAGRGEDSVVDAPDGVTDTVIGGLGLDTIVADSGKPLAIHLGAQTLASGSETDRFNSFERAHGGAGADTLTGSPGGDLLSGDNGDDTIDGGGGNDWLSGDIGAPFLGSGGEGDDVIKGGAGDDLLDGREETIPDLPDPRARPPHADSLRCGEGDDTIISQTNDISDQACEAAGFSATKGSYQGVYDDGTVLMAPVARGADGAPTYSVGCPSTEQSPPTQPCTGRVQLEDPPAEGSSDAPRVLGTGTFEIPRGERQNVTVVLNDAGKSVAQNPEAYAVHVIAEKGNGMYPGPTADFGWHQVNVFG